MNIMPIQAKCQLENNVDTKVEHYRIHEQGYVFSTLKKALKYAEEYFEMYPSHQGKFTICKVEPLKCVRRDVPPVIVEDLT